MKFVNRSVLVLKPTAKMPDWINSAGEESVSHMVFDLAGDHIVLQTYDLTRKLDREYIYSI